MRALISLGLDLLGHPYWLIGCLIGLGSGIWLCVEANRDAKRDWQQREIDAELRAAERERWQQRPAFVQAAARTIRDSHPDHRFNLDEDERDFLSSLGISPDGPKAA